MSLFDARICHLGEGAFWHPGREQFFWFDILEKRLLSRREEQPLSWQMGEYCSAAGWIDRDQLLISSEKGLFTFDLETGNRQKVIAIEADNPKTRSNDGRADPLGGFWHSTMGLGAEPGAGAIYRWYRGELRQLYDGITVPNAICFAEGCAYYADSPTGKVWRQPLDAQGWPEGAPQLFIDFSAEGLKPDGAVVCAAGHLWIAQWGAGQVSEHDAEGNFLRSHPVSPRQSSCPAFGGADLTTLYVTSATQDLDPAALRLDPDAGQTFALEGKGPGLPAPQVLLG